MPTSCNTHDYDGKLRQKWFEMRSMLITKYLPNCLSFDNTIKDIEQWLDKKYFNVKRIGRARRSLKILMSSRHSNFDSRNEINVEELLPILWDKVKNQEDIHDTFYEQLCDITGGSCSQGRSTRLFQFLFLFDLPSEPPSTTSKTEEEKIELSNEQQPIEKDFSAATSSTTTKVKEEKTEISSDQEPIEKDPSSQVSSTTLKFEEEKMEISTEQKSIKKDLSSETTLEENSVSISEEKQELQEKSKSHEEQSPRKEERLHKDEQLHTEDETKGEQQLEEELQPQRDKKSDYTEQINSSSDQRE
ncbi:unnamed protein product [Rotaria sp. Silwood2]|nr:unnamed protein product [Rotaria sp. Silwood2]CAF2699916.1 unnamed protein product [Rotaria sp. Silwood2]CAF2976563.1 unnamed protein product [Rotaria sp. Silwood2]CAF3122732.1 unnamed protein product [Rotaria sp. Silwood2]CAF3950235.1 unnamed protein product [Rotaria sp. Silwood2]